MYENKKRSKKMKFLKSVFLTMFFVIYTVLIIFGMSYLFKKNCMIESRLTNVESILVDCNMWPAK
jgi:hypothetical protein